MDVGHCVPKTTCYVDIAYTRANLQFYKEICKSISNAWNFQYLQHQQQDKILFIREALVLRVSLDVTVRSLYCYLVVTGPYLRNSLLLVGIKAP